MNRRSILKFLSFLFLGSLSLTGLKTLSFLSKPAPKKIFLNKNELEKVDKLHLYDEFILVKENKKFLIFSRKCPHLGCKLNYDPSKELIVCPCHQSKFSLGGKYLEGPAKKDLKELPFELKEDGLSIEIS